MYKLYPVNYFQIYTLQRYTGYSSVLTSYRKRGNFNKRPLLQTQYQYNVMYKLSKSRDLNRGAENFTPYTFYTCWERLLIFSKSMGARISVS